MEAFLAARDRGAVRALLTTRARSITTDCQVVWRSHRTTRTTEWVDLLEAGLAAYEAGHTEAAQALFANVLDSITFAIPGPDRRRYTNHKWGDADYEHLLEEDLATGLAIMPLWRVHEENWADKGHDVPREFNRHATLHRVSSRQYTKRNALQSMMLATTFLPGRPTTDAFQTQNRSRRSHSPALKATTRPLTAASPDPRPHHRVAVPG